MPAKQDRISTLDARMAEPGFWDSPDTARDVIAEANQHKAWVEPWLALEQKGRDLEELAELLEVDADETLEAEWQAELERYIGEAGRLEVRAMLSGPDDGRDALLTIHPGAGGTESQDWAEMLMRMYTRWAEQHGFDVTILDLMEGEEAGIKSVTLEVKGENAYGYLKAEKGVHRLVRISPFDSQSRRHTSFASVFVYPVVDDTIEIEIEDKDLRIDVYRASGAGGQHVNKTSSAVRITHEPTGLVAACQNERSQFQNKATAMKMLRAALYERELGLRNAEKEKVEAEKTDNAWGNQIRSYVFQPYTQVTDHRTELKIGDVQRVMNGDLDPFIEKYLKTFGARVA
ncbi:MAG TPA: peptide chain release factor 2 [Longimicrobiales bacterium]|nr:peptide chain release factor 2 [Longimicrobiales bacterium]